MKQAILVGAPNCGKSSLFRLLTGRRVRTGNRAGVTVEALSARIPGTDWNLTDLPGIRSLSAGSEDEAVTVSCLRDSTPDLVLAVCDATALSGQYPLLRELHRSLFPSVPAILLLNCCDELASFPSSAALRKLPFRSLALSARSGEGVDGLRALFRSGELPAPGVPHRSFLPELRAVTGGASPSRARRLAAWDRVLLQPVFGRVLFALLMICILWLVFGTPGSRLTDGFASVCVQPAAMLLRKLRLAGWLRSLLSEGVLGGVGAVLGFFPRLLVLFLIQTFLEQSGYLARVSRLFDPWLVRFGLRGDAVAPLLLGFGCTVPAVLCTRGMKDPCARRRCAGYLPTVACSARIPLCLTVSDAFFPGNGWWICALLWVFSGILFLVFCALDQKRDRGCPAPVCHDDAMPTLRIPALSDLLGAAFEQLTHFFSRAGGPILLTSVGVWLLSHFRPGVAGMVEPGESALAAIGGLLAPLFRLPGLDDWRVISALLAGVGAKEAALSTLGVLLNVQDGHIGAALVASGVLTARSALALLVFYLFYFPCAATLTVQKRPRRLLLPLLFAYFAATLVRRIEIFR